MTRSSGLYSCCLLTPPINSDRTACSYFLAPTLTHTHTHKYVYTRPDRFPMIFDLYFRSHQVSPTGGAVEGESESCKQYENDGFGRRRLTPGNEHRARAVIQRDALLVFDVSVDAAVCHRTLPIAGVVESTRFRLIRGHNKSRVVACTILWDEK